MRVVVGVAVMVALQVGRSVALHRLPQSGGWGPSQVAARPLIRTGLLGGSAGEDSTRWCVARGSGPASPREVVLKLDVKPKGS